MQQCARDLNTPWILIQLNIENKKKFHLSRPINPPPHLHLAQLFFPARNSGGKKEEVQSK